MVEQGDPTLIGLGLSQFEQGADLETLGIPCVTSLKRGGGS